MTVPSAPDAIDKLNKKRAELFAGARTDRSDAGVDIVMKHENINSGGAKMPTYQKPETDEQRKERTELSSLRMTDDESKKVQKTPNRVALDSMLAKIVDTEFIHPTTLPSMTIAVIKLTNGFVLVGKSTPADPENYDEELGKKFAREDAIRQMWVLEAYVLREQMSVGG